jgi:hypothetical protein
MAFQLGSFIVQLLGDTTHLDNAMKSVGQGVSSLTGSLKGAVGGGLNIPGLDQAKTKLGEAAEHGRTLRDEIAKLAEIPIDKIFKLGTMAGFIGLVGAATKKFMDLSDEMKNTEFRFKSLGMETTQNTKKFFDFGKQIQDTFGLAQKEARALSMDALTKSANPARYQEMTAAAISLAAATGKSNASAMHAIEQLEAGNTRVLRGMHTSFRIAMEQGASRFTLENMVNKMVAEGGIMAQERMKTFGGQIDRMKNKFNDLSSAVARAIGPAMAPIVMKLADAMGHLADKLNAYITANQETIGQTIRNLAAFSLAALGVALFKGRIMKLSGVLKHLIPDVQGLWSVFRAGQNIAPFQGAWTALKSFKNAILTTVGAAIQGGVQIALGLYGAVGKAATIARSPIMIWNGLVSLSGVVAGIASVGVKLLSTAMKGLMFASGIGILVGLIGMVMGVADTFGEASGGVASFGSTMKEAFADLLKVVMPVWEWIKVEGMIVFKALIASARQMVEIVMEIWHHFESGWAVVVGVLKENFGGLVHFMEDTFGIKLASMKEMWEDFTVELAVIGFRIRKVFLEVQIGLTVIGETIRWLGSVFKAFGDYIANNWKQILLGSFNTLVSAIGLLGHAVKDIGNGIMNALSGKAVSFDFSATENALKDLKNKANGVMAEMKLPKLDTDSAIAGLVGEYREASAMLDRKRNEARDAQNRDRTNSQNRATGKTDGATGAKTGNVQIGGRDKAHFAETVSFWKKVQESGANQRAEYLQLQQLDQQREMVRILNLIQQNSATKPNAPGGVVPR